MARMLMCAKLKKEAEGLDHPPYPGKLGQRIYETISKEAWDEWMQRQTMLINEYRLSMMDPNARTFVTDQMKQFLFHEGE